METEPESNRYIDRAGLAAIGRRLRSILALHRYIGITGYGPTGHLFRPGPASGRVRAPGRPGSRGRVSAANPAGPRAATMSTPPDRHGLVRAVAGCQRCPLASDRLGQVMGDGSDTPRLLVVGDWSRQRPDGFSAATVFGPEEDRMVWRMMAAIGLDRDRVFVTNLLKCCPAGDRVDPAWTAACRDHLAAQIGLLRPELILALGEPAAAVLTGSRAPLVRLRGRWHRGVAGATPVPVMVSFHPVFLLANPEMKSLAWQDLQLVQRRLRTTCPVP